MARKEGRVAVPKVEKFWFSFLDTVRAFGRTYEIGTMALYMMRSCACSPTWISRPRR